MLQDDDRLIKFALIPDTDKYIAEEVRGAVERMHLDDIFWRKREFLWRKSWGTGRDEGYGVDAAVDF